MVQVVTKLPDVMHNVMEIVMQTLGVDVAINVAGIYKKKNGDFFLMAQALF